MKELFMVGYLGSFRKFNYNKNGENLEGYNLSVATRDNKGNTEWVKVMLFGKLTALAKYLYVGAQLIITGTPRCEIYEKRDGTTGACLSVVARKVVLPPKAANPANGNDAPAADPAPAIDYDEDNPF